MPGTRLLAVVRLWLDEATVSRVIEPLVADWQAEYASAAPTERGKVRVTGAVSLAATVTVVAARAAVREALRPPRASDVATMLGVGAVTSAAVVAYAAVFGTIGRLDARTVAAVVLGAWAAAIWRRLPTVMARPLGTFVKWSAILVVIAALVQGPLAIVYLVPIAMAMAASSLPGPKADNGRRLVLVFGPIAVLALLNPALDLGSWPIGWRHALQVAWGLWCVAACSIDATRTVRTGARLAAK